MYDIAAEEVKRARARGSGANASGGRPMSAHPRRRTMDDLPCAPRRGLRCSDLEIGLELDGTADKAPPSKRATSLALVDRPA